MLAVLGVDDMANVHDVAARLLPIELSSLLRFS